MLVGLTGGIGSGKSTVAGMLREAGVTVIDADAIAREVVEPGGDVLPRIVERFGSDVIDDGVLDRAALASIVFDDDGARSDLEEITHPAIRADIERRHRAAEAADPDAVVVLDHPLLIETGQHRDLEALVVVLAESGTRRDRLMADRGMEPTDVDARMATQVDDRARRDAATWIVDNDGSLADLEAQVEGLLAHLGVRASAAPGSSASAHG